jgi:hypothetical protein
MAPVLKTHLIPPFQSVTHRTLLVETQCFGHVPAQSVGKVRRIVRRKSGVKGMRKYAGLFQGLEWVPTTGLYVQVGKEVEVFHLGVCFAYSLALSLSSCVNVQL